MTNGTLKRAKLELMKKNFKLLSIILYGCGGVIFQSQFFRILGRKNISLLEDFKECNLVRTKKIGNNNVIALKNAVFQYFNLPNKCTRLTANRLQHSAILCEMLLYLYGDGNIDAMESAIRCSNLGYFCPERSLQILKVIREHFEPQYTEDELSALSWAIERHKEKTAFVKGSMKGRKETLPAPTVPYIDLLTLKGNDVYLREADSHGKVLRLYMAIFATGKDAAQIAELIRKTEQSLSDTFGVMEIQYSFEIFSLTEHLVATENRIFNNLMTFSENTGKEDFYRNILSYHWFNCKNHLFSGIDIDKWL